MSTTYLYRMWEGHSPTELTVRCKTAAEAATILGCLAKNVHAVLGSEQVSNKEQTEHTVHIKRTDTWTATIEVDAESQADAEESLQKQCDGGASWEELTGSNEDGDLADSWCNVERLDRCDMGVEIGNTPTGLAYLEGTLQSIFRRENSMIAEDDADSFAHAVALELASVGGHHDQEG